MSGNHANNDQESGERDAPRAETAVTNPPQRGISAGCTTLLELRRNTPSAISVRTLPTRTTPQRCSDCRQGTVGDTLALESKGKDAPVNDDVQRTLSLYFCSLLSAQETSTSSHRTAVEGSMSDEEVTSLLMFKDRKGECSRQVLSKPCMVLLRRVWLFGRAGGVRLPSLPAEKH